MGKGIVEKLKDDYDFEIELIGFEIHPETPEKGVMLKDRFPGFERGIQNLRDIKDEHGKDFGDLTMLHNSYKALLVAEKAKELGLSHEFSNRMFEANFKDAIDINDLEVIKKVALESGLTTNDLDDALENEVYKRNLEENLQLGRSYGVNSIPTFIINDQYKVVGSRSQNEIRSVFDQILAEDLS